MFNGFVDHILELASTTSALFAFGCMEVVLRELLVNLKGFFRCLVRTLSVARTLGKRCLFHTINQNGAV